MFFAQKVKHGECIYVLHLYSCTTKWRTYNVVDCSLKFPSRLFLNTCLLQQWVGNVRRMIWKPTQHSRLCAHHFEEECLRYDDKGKVCLTPTVVPTIFSFPDRLQKHICIDRTLLMRKPCRGTILSILNSLLA
uniref:THAP-type domain-containing protein n=1 Tax=Hucho hucho TaxID=62062 RepID=A0A4W5Q399_9TELE